MIKWSGEQLKAINHSTAENGSAIVSAAAGSGKTAMLVERITHLITSESPRIPADRIVAVTFTNDAAAELKIRLETAVNELMQLFETPWLAEQLINLESAHICTISSFCINLLRDYAQEAGVKPDFKICEGKETEHFSQQALESALEAVYDGVSFTPEEKSILRSITGEAGDRALGRAVLELYAEYIKQPFPEKWLKEKSALYNNSDSNGFADLIETRTQRIKAGAEYCLGLIEECFKLSYSDSMTARLEADLAFAESWLGGESGRLEFGNSHYGKVSDENIAAKEQIKELRDEYLPIFKDIIITAGLLVDFSFVTAKQAPQVQLLSKLFMLYREKFHELKTQANCMDFSDAEHFILRLLQNNAIAGQIRNGFYEIIVDEFQDSNAVQYEIFRRLGSGRNLFFVGDVKQSIYRFRNADQRVFTRVTESPDYTTLTLNKNYRSSREVIGAVNEIFGKSMTRETGGVDYGESVKLIFGLSTEARPENEAELIIIENAENTKKSEADYIAARIVRMVADGFQVAEKDGSLRPCNYGDFAVLVSGLATVEEEFGAAFEELGIPFDKQKSGDYREIPEIKTVLALLTVIEKPFDDMALLTVLMSPLYNFTADDIAKARANGVNKPLFGCLNNCAFINDHRRWSAYSHNHGAKKLIRLIYDEGGFNPLAAASSNPAKTMTNIRLLLHYSESLASLTRDTLWGLVEALGGKSGAVLEEARFSSENGAKRVKLMTIHASKGLEFPVCFVARTNARFNLRENYSDIIFNDEIGFAMRYIIPETRTRCDTLLHKKAREENQAAAISEEMRKLYVACTRARDKLILTAALKPEQEPAKNSYLNWLVKTGIKQTVIQPLKTEIITEKIKAVMHKNESQEIITAVKRVYAREPLTEIPRRVTATQIGTGGPAAAVLSDDITGSGKLQDEPTVFPRGASFMKNKKLTGKKRGDAYHKMMELLDFKEINIERQMNTLRNRFTAEEFSAIEPEKIKAFFTSPLGLRACASTEIQKEFKLCMEISLSELGCPKEFDMLFEDEKPFVQGIADMFFYEDGGIILVDYKTNRNTNPGELIRSYQNQLGIYARAVAEMTGTEVAEKWIYSFELGEVQIF
ncbi:MAG: UvrD-helicase domain-containing protein [Oscillospiraceae bacterium]|nr:UvrD-helicase domain-containing protein [Oscillospiraceae bacterium]